MESSTRSSGRCMRRCTGHSTRRLDLLLKQEISMMSQHRLLKGKEDLYWQSRTMTEIS
jgi:hypothetical protein